MFTTFNLFLQRDTAQIYILHSQNLLKKLLSKLIKPAVIQRHTENLSEIVYRDSENQLEKSKSFIGLFIASQIRKKYEDGILLTGCEEMSFFGDCILHVSCQICFEVVSSS